MKQYLLIQAHEGGNPVKFLDDVELEALLASPNDYTGIEEFLSGVPEQKDPNYWDERSGLLLEVKVVVPRARTTAFTLDKE